MLSRQAYYNIIQQTTLTSIDLFFVNGNRILLGRRLNEPAKNYWFTPGCRTYKYETQRQGIQRVAKQEVGLNIDPNLAKFIGVYDHIYINNFMDNSFGTHYVNSAYMYLLSDAEYETIQKDEQHDSLLMMSIDEVLRNENVHLFVRNTLNDMIYDNMIYYNNCVSV